MFAAFEGFGLVLVFSCDLGLPFALAGPGVLDGGGGTVAVDAILSDI